MANILIASATPFEIAPFVATLQPLDRVNALLARYRYAEHHIAVLTSGVGMVNMAFAMGQLGEGVFDYAINAGICGSFRESLPKGTTVAVAEDHLAELGAEDDGAFLRLEDLNLGESVYRANPFETPTIKALPVVTGITVNKVHGRDASIAQITDRLNPDVESMEGAAFFRACNYYGFRSLQLKTVSNRVERRNRNAWDIPLALANLNSNLLAIINELT